MRQNKAQTMLEYTIIIGIVVTAFFAMNTMFKRGIQGMVKVVADQVGNQVNADQNFDPEGGYLERSYLNTRVSTDKQTIDTVGNIQYIFDDAVMTNSEAFINLGFDEDN